MEQSRESRSVRWVRAGGDGWVNSDAMHRWKRADFVELATELGRRLDGGLCCCALRNEGEGDVEELET